MEISQPEIRIIKSMETESFGQDNGAFTPTEIFLYDIPSGTITEVSAQDGNTTTFNVDPKIDGDQIVWQSEIGILYYDLRRGNLTNIMPSFNTSTPDIDGNRIVYTEVNQVNSNTFDFQIYLAENCAPVFTVPTIGEWGLFIIVLLLMAVGQSALMFQQRGIQV